jgi:trimeric autotransporter adhesin
MAVTRINNNQITDASTGNIYVGINAGTKLQDYSITAGKIANSLVYGSDLTISGNLTVNGQTTTIDTVSTVIEDPLIVLASNQTGSPSVDIGFIGERGTANNIAFIWDESATEFATTFTSSLVTNTTVTISSYANFHTNDANIGGNITINGTTTLVGNIASALNVTGNVTGGNLLTSGVVTATGNITGANLSAGSGIISTTGNINGANVNATAGITAGTTVIATGNVTGGNLNTAGQVVATGNVNGGNITTSGLTSTGTLAVSSTSSFTGNITSAFNVTGNIAGGNISTPGLITAVGNVTGGNLVTTGVTQTGTLTTTGNALVGGNLIVQGNITYINIDDLRVEDPIIILGTGPNGAPLTVDDGMDRGTFMEYYKSGARGNAFVGWDNGSGNMVIAASASFTGNNVVAYNAYGTLEAGNLYIQSAVSTGNVTGGNLNTAGQVVATGNVNGGNIITTGNVNSNQGYFTGNVTVVGTFTSTSNIIANTSGTFFGNAVTGNGAIFAGVPSFTSLGSNVVAQFSGNVNSYSQINFENINSGNRASTDFIATADNGTDSTNYLDLGINSSTFNDPVNYPGFGPNDSYVHNHGGNLILNPESSGKTIKMMISGTANSDVISTVSSQGVFVNVGNLYTPNITSLSGRVTINSGSDDVDFAVNGDTSANVFYVDAGTGTASFGNSTQTTNAIVSFNATNSVLMPVGNTQQRPSTGVVGMLRFNTVGDALEVYDSGGWTEVGTPVFTVIADQQFTGNGVQVAYTLGSSQTTASCIVSINGIVQIPTIAYSVSGTTLTFTEAPEPGDIIDVRQLTTTTTITAISNTGGNAIIQPNPLTANVDVTGNLVISGSVSAAGFIGLDATKIANGTSEMAVIASGGNIRANVGGTTVQTISAGLVAITGDLSVTGNATLSGNILGDRVQNGTTSFDIQTPSGNANITVGATSNVAVFSTAGANIAGTLGVTGNITGGNLSGTSIVGTLTTAAQTNITSVGTLGSLTVTANVAGGNLTTAGQVVATGNINGGNLNVTGNLVDSAALEIITGSNGNITLSPNGTGVIVANKDIRNGQANGVGNIGSSTGYFNTVFAQATSAQYADLAEKYVADAEYAPGTVVVFGGDKEVTVSSTDADRAVAGVVSTNPSYIMNGGLEAEHVATVALTGRVPCRVTGTVRKGDLMVSAGYGVARAEADPRVGTVIGKALENHEGTEGVIEVVVGRF